GGGGGGLRGRAADPRPPPARPCPCHQPGHGRSDDGLSLRPPIGAAARTASAAERARPVGGTGGAPLFPPAGLHRHLVRLWTAVAVAPRVSPPAAAPAMSMRAVGRRRPTLHLVLLVALLALPGRALGEDGVLACHTAIEAGSRTWAEASLDASERCAHHARARFGPCVERAFRDGAFSRLRRRWGKRAARACQGLAVGPDLGYLASCVPATATSPCAFPSDRVDAPRPRNDLIDCLACQIGERLQDAGAALLASAPIREGCRRTLGDGGIGVLRMLLDELYGCVGLPEGASLAACLAEPRPAARIETAMASWRATSEQRCAGVDPLKTLGYPALCAGIEPTVPPGWPDACSAR